MAIVYIVFLIVVLISFITGIILTIIENKKISNDSKNVLVDEEII